MSVCVLMLITMVVMMMMMVVMMFMVVVMMVMVLTAQRHVDGENDRRDP